MALADAHVHLFADGYAGAAGLLLRDEVRLYEQLRLNFGIERALVVGYEGEERYSGNSAYVLELARARPWIVPLVYLHHRDPSIEELRRFEAEGAAGYSIYVADEEGAHAVSSWPPPVLTELNRQRAVISLNSTAAATTAIAPFVDALGSCTVLFSHLGLPGRFATTPTRAQAAERLRSLLVLGDRPNVSVKFSGLYAISDPAHDFPHDAARPVLDVVLEAFGAERLCWGSDFAPALEFVSFPQLADDRLLSDLSSAEIAAVMGGNLQRLLPTVRERE